MAKGDVVKKKNSRQFREKSPSEYSPAYPSTLRKATKAVETKKALDRKKWTAEQNARNGVIREEKATEASRRLDEEEKARVALLQRAAAVELMDTGEHLPIYPSATSNGVVFGGPAIERAKPEDEEDSSPLSSSRRFVTKDETEEEEEEEDVEVGWDAPLAVSGLDKDLLLSLCHSLLEEKEEEKETSSYTRKHSRV